MLPVLERQHIPQLNLWPIFDFLVQQTTLPDKTLIAFEDGREKRVTIDLILSDIAVQHPLHFLPAARSTQETHHLGIGIENSQIVQVVECQWPEQQVFRLYHYFHKMPHIVQNKNPQPRPFLSYASIISPPPDCDNA